MTRNVGRVDRGIRIVVGLAIIGIGIAYQSWWGALGAIPITVASIGWCPPFSLVGISTMTRRDRERLAARQSSGAQLG